MKYIDTGALIHGAIALVGVFLAMGSGIYGFALVAPAFFYGREMRDSQREPGRPGHRNTFLLRDLLPGVFPVKMNNLQDWVFPLAVTLIYFAMR